MWRPSGGLLLAAATLPVVGFGQLHVNRVILVDLVPRNAGGVRQAIEMLRPTGSVPSHVHLVRVAPNGQRILDLRLRPGGRLTLAFEPRYIRAKRVRHRLAP